MSFDVDIDLPGYVDRNQFGVRGSLIGDNGHLKAHPSAHYIFTNITIDEATGLAAIDVKEAQKLGFIKVDLLSNSGYDRFETKEELLKYHNQEPNWRKFEDKKIVQKLPHIGNWADLVIKLAPQSLEDLADILALIRPGKSNLVDDYRKDKERVRKRLYKPPTNGMYFKKSHAIAYAAMIICILNKMMDKKKALYF